MDKFEKLITVLLLLYLVQTLPTQTQQTDIKSGLKFIVLHNNDMHSNFEQTSKYSTQCHQDDVISNKCYGGFARVLTVLKKYRTEANNGGTSVLYLNAGDTYVGTPWFSVYKDRIVAEFLNILKPDAISLGNHEFDLGVEGLRPLLEAVNFPVLIANLNNSDPLFNTQTLKRSVVFDINGHKVGVVGYLTPETKQLVPPIDVEFKPEVESINEEAEKLKKKGVNIIIALGHSGYQVDQQIAFKCELVDLVIGGHSNTFLYSGPKPDTEEIDGPYPTIIIQPSGKKVPVVQAYAFTKYLGELELNFDDAGNLIEWSGQPIVLNGRIARDPEVLQLLDKYRPAVEALTKENIGITKVFLDGYQCRAFECNLGNLITDAMVHTNALKFSGKYWTDAGIAIILSGDIRSSAEVGNLTRFGVTTILPFNNELLIVNVTGQSLWDALEHSVYRYSGDRGEFLQMSGIHVVYNLSLPSNHRVVSAKVVCTDCAVPKYQPIDLKKYYAIVMSSFLYDGGDGFLMFKKYKPRFILATYTDALYDYIHKFHTVYPAIEGRITLNGRIPSPHQVGGASLTHISINLILVAVLLNTVLQMQI